MPKPDIYCIAHKQTPSMPVEGGQRTSLGFTIEIKVAHSKLITTLGPLPSSWKRNAMINEEAARRLVEAANDVTQEVVSIFRSVDEEQRELKLALASVIYRIMEEVVVPILAEFPDFKAEFEGRMNGPLKDAEG